MSRQNLWTPISILAAGLAIIILVLAGPGARDSAAARDQPSLQGQEAPYPPYPPQTTVTPGTATPRTTTPGTTTPITRTVTPGTTTPITQTTTAAATRTPSPTTTSRPSSPATSPQPTTTPAAPTSTPTLSNELTCVPGIAVEITGEGSPRAPFLLYFNQRAVSGGSIEPDGRFSIPLVVGDERAGEYQVVVRVRGTRQILRQLTCTVPAVTPTPFAAQSFVGR